MCIKFLTILFYEKDLNISREGRILLSIRPEEAYIFDLYAKQFKESKRSKTEMDIIFK
jgi:hypothetical protein